MSRVTYTNTTDQARYVGNVLVPAHGTRTVDGSLLPSEPTEAEPMIDPLQALADGNAPEVIDALPGLDTAQLDALIVVERAGKDRKTVIEAIELRKLELIDEAELAAAEQAAAEQASDPAK